MSQIYDDTACELGEGPLWHPGRGQLSAREHGGTRLCRYKEELHLCVYLGLAHPAHQRKQLRPQLGPRTDSSRGRNQPAGAEARRACRAPFRKVRRADAADHVDLRFGRQDRAQGFEAIESQITMKRPLSDDICANADAVIRKVQEQCIDIAQLAQAPICYTFALIQGREVGHCTCLTLDRPSAHTDIQRAGVYMLGVNAFHRRKGIGRAMMVASMKTLLAYGMQEIELMTAADNRIAQAFYRSLGFRVYRRWFEATLALGSNRTGEDLT